MKKNNLLTILLVAIVTLSKGQEKVWAPVLISPADFATNQMTKVLVDWQPVSTAYMYEVQHDTNNLFTNPIITFSNYSAAYISDLFYNTAHYWKVRAFGIYGDTSAWSVTRVFTVKEKPIITYPLDSTGNFHIKPDIKWQEITGSYFHIQFDTISDFSSPLSDTLYGTDMNAVSKTVDLGYYGKDIYIRVRAYHQADTSVWSDIVFVSTRPELPLITPADNITNAIPVCTLEFKAIVGSVLYQYEYALNDTFFNSSIVSIVPILATNFFMTGNDTIIRIKADTLPYGKTVYWRARAISSVDTTVWSFNPRRINVIGGVTLIAPQSDAIEIGITPTFNWSKIEGTVGYDLEYSDNALFLTNVKSFKIPQPATSTVFYTVSSPPLDSNTVYYWRVRAYNGKYVSGWAEASFTTITSIDDDFSLSKNLSIYPNPSKGKVYLSLNAPFNDEYSVSISNLLGQTILTNTGVLNKGKNLVILNLSGFANGLYFISINTGHHSFTQKIVIDK